METNAKCQTEKMSGFSGKSSAAIIIFLLLHFTDLAQSHPVSNAKGQVLSAAVTINNYSVAQKRLLVVSAAQFINQITENNLDKDSVMLMACQITGMPFLLPYNNGFANKVSGGEDFINSGKITEAIKLLKNLKGEKHIQLQLELGIWYLHQPGSHKRDLDSADFYVDRASKLSALNKNIKRENECLFLLGELYYQKGSILKSKEIFTQLVSSGQKEGDAEIEARAYQHLGSLFPVSDSMQRAYYQRSLELYQKLQ